MKRIFAVCRETTPVEHRIRSLERQVVLLKWCLLIGAVVTAWLHAAESVGHADPPRDVRLVSSDGRYAMVLLPDSLTFTDSNSKATVFVGTKSDVPQVALHSEIWRGHLNSGMGPGDVLDSDVQLSVPGPVGPLNPHGGPGLKMWYVAKGTLLAPIQPGLPPPNVGNQAKLDLFVGSGGPAVNGGLYIQGQDIAGVISKIFPVRP
jgi:hypothetical protein